LFSQVIPSQRGEYWDPVAVLDFASLYPSIMRAYNICWMTYVKPSSRFDNLPGYDYDDIEWIEDDGTRVRHRFVQNVDCIIAPLQSRLYESRQEVKKRLAKEKARLAELRASPRECQRESERECELLIRVLSGREQAIKITMNALYGFCSAYLLYMQELAACITAVGRRMINQTKVFMEEGFPRRALDEGWTDRLLDLRVIAGDTDSVFVLFAGCTNAEAIFLATKAEKLLTEEVFARPPIRMEYEKIYNPLFVLKKKNYIGQMFEKDPDKPVKRDCKGIAAKRRNYCGFVKDVYERLMACFFEHGREEGRRAALETLRSSLEKLLDLRSMDYGYLAVSAQIKAKYANENLPHVELAKRMKARDPGSEPQIGERFLYIVVTGTVEKPWAKSGGKSGSGKSNKSVAGRAEDPYFAAKHGLTPDPLYYLEQQLRKPITDFLSVAGSARDECRAIFDRFHWKAFRAREGYKHIAEYLEAPVGVARELPEGSLRRPAAKKRRVAQPLGLPPRGITSFFASDEQAAQGERRERNPPRIRAMGPPPVEKKQQTLDFTPLKTRKS
jgi:DNA polymerase delta subunit 1